MEGDRSTADGFSIAGGDSRGGSVAWQSLSEVGRQVAGGRVTAPALVGEGVEALRSDPASSEQSIVAP